jgi:predicted RNA-binding protein associated with RNAse of E/G family
MRPVKIAERRAEIRNEERSCVDNLDVIAVGGDLAAKDFENSMRAGCCGIGMNLCILRCII